MTSTFVWREVVQTPDIGNIFTKGKRKNGETITCIFTLREIKREDVKMLCEGSALFGYFSQEKIC